MRLQFCVYIHVCTLESRLYGEVWGPLFTDVKIHTDESDAGKDPRMQIYTDQITYKYK